MGSPQPAARPGAISSRSHASRNPFASPSTEADPRRLRLWLVEPSESFHAARIESASDEAGLSVARVDAVESAPANAPLIGIGPSVSDPLRIARHLRATGSQAHLVFFASSSGASNALQAELLRDPFVYPRYDIVALPNNPRQLAMRIGKVVSQVQPRLHVRRTSQRGRNRARTPAANPSSSTTPLLAHILAHTRDAVLTTDEKGRAVMWNEPAGRLLWLDGERTTPDAPVSLTRPEQRDLAELIGHVLATGQAREAHVSSVGEHGEQVLTLASVAPIRDPRGTQIGTTIIARSDTDYQRVQAALREANQRKDEFLAIMSHELRTPLTSILGYTDMLLRGLSGPLAPMANKYVSNVRSAGDRLLELVNTLLDYTRLEAGVERLELRPVNLGRVISHVVQLFHSTARSKDVDLRVAIQEGLDTTVEADEDRVTHVFRSMLGNALKFTPNGGWVNVMLEPSAEPEPGVRVSVSDSGIGMRAEQVGRVWERFYQGDASLTRPYGGMGLGLSIARHLVFLHGGNVGAESSGPGSGSTFWFSLPRRQAT